MGSKGGAIPAASQPQAFRNLHVQESAWGQVIPIRYGEQRCAFNLLMAQRFQSVAVPTPGTIAIKKGGGSVLPTTFNYFVDAIGGLGEGVEFGDTTSKLNIGRATPGHQVIAVNDGVDPNNNSIGEVKIQPTQGVDPGCWRGKVVRYLAPHAGSPIKHGWRPMHWHNFGTLVSQYYLSRDGDLAQDIFTGTAKTFYVANFNENYTGIAFVGIQKWTLGSSASLPQMNFPPRLLKQYNDWYGPTLDATNPCYDADPAMIAQDLLANAKHGAGWHRQTDPLADSPGLVPVGSPRDFTRFLDRWPNPWGAGVLNGSLTGPGLADSWSAYCRANDLMLSPGYDAQRPMSEILTELAEITNCAPLWSEGMLKMIPRSNLAATSGWTGATYTPTTDPTVYTTGARTVAVAHLTVDDFLPQKGREPIEIENQSVVPDHGSAGMFNDVPLEFEDRANAYATTMASPPAVDEASISMFGPLSHETLSYHAIKSPGIGADVAHRALQNFGTVRNLYRFKLGAAHDMKEPMDIVTLTYAPLGLDHFPVRIRTMSTDKTGIHDVEAEEYPEAFPAAAPPPAPTDFVGDVSPNFSSIPFAIEPDVSVQIGTPSATGNPRYFDLTTATQSIDPGASLFTGEGAPVGFIVTEIQAFPYVVTGDASEAYGELRIVVAGVVQDGIVLRFRNEDIGTPVVATGSVSVPAGALVGLCWQIIFPNGALVDPKTNTTQFGVNGTVQVESA